MNTDEQPNTEFLNNGALDPGDPRVLKYKVIAAVHRASERGDRAALEDVLARLDGDPS